MLLLIDNYDSFTYNLVQYFQILEQPVKVVSNDEITIPEIERLNPEYLVISPGPNRPEDAGISMDAIRHFHQKLPILGVCLGHQCLAQVFGGRIIHAPQVMHGKTSRILHHKLQLFKDVPNPFLATRYHSLIVETASLPTCFSIDAWANNDIMAISHRQYPLFGVQFHPESILTEHGLHLLRNFLNHEHYPLS
ncbi:anthranilate synthase component II [Legionella birminghamensis]|uniref:Anthranilate synthase component II n=1 Tax=Legionella birminghamensis TaxID=28083 RepID=A0A378IB72_9GAMM|nr:aminodeoxychorismate/anthranilate synthase component II [Legionella birminghamensis]KTC67769.1 anthranilate synthase component II [Legionella birminghamensis]STX32032.1 anthranilate synthase component II [Legionella birminghamensis]